MVEINKVCSKCWNRLSIDQFNKDKTRVDGYSYICRGCTSTYSKERYHRSPESHDANRNEKEYGISPDELLDLIEGQNYSCATCEAHITLERKNAHRANIDHCHKTGKIRGLLCRDCNLALGNVKDNIKTLSKMIAYLNK